MTIPPQYNANTPNVNDDLATSQGIFATNFQQLFDAFLKNHVSLDDATLAGNHNIIELVEQGKGFQTDAGEISIYSKDVDGQTDQLFLRYQGNGTEVQITNYQIYRPSQVAGQESYFTFLPGKILIYFGTVTPSATANGNSLTFWPAITKNVIGVNFCAKGSTPNVSPSVQLDPAVNGFYSVFRMEFIRQAATSYYYMVVGNI